MESIKRFFRLESAPGLLLVLAAVSALLVENSHFNYIYDLFLTLPVSLQVGSWVIAKPLLLWINDGLMAVFFLLVALEMKRELIIGELSKPANRILPSIAAIGGLLFPALIYVFFNYDDPIALRGWAIPSATDIAFALGVLTLLGSRVPKELKILLVAIAILDDVAAIVIIAIFYTSSLSWLALALGGMGALMLATLNRLNIHRLGPYLVVGIFIWVCVLKSGVHATLAGVLLGLFIPISTDKPEESLLEKVEHDLTPWVGFAILPIFAFANAGVPLHSLSLEMLLDPITLGVILGLCLGAPFGVCLAIFSAVYFKIAELPKNVSYPQCIGMALLTGIGFTMSLFIGTLAFEDVAHQNLVRLGVLCGSLISAVLGSVVLCLFRSKNNEITE